MILSFFFRLNFGTLNGMLTWDAEAEVQLKYRLPEQGESPLGS